VTLRERLRERTRWVRDEVYALALACRDPRTPWPARILAACVVAYAFSPLDLIPDFIPVFGYLDDLVLVPLGVLLVRRLIPAPLLAEHRARVAELRAAGKPTSRAGAVAVVIVWLLCAALAARVVAAAFGIG